MSTVKNKLKNGILITANRTQSYFLIFLLKERIFCKRNCNNRIISLPKVTQSSKTRKKGALFFSVFPNLFLKQERINLKKEKKKRDFSAFK